jgi:hypothetical protein
MHFQGDDMKQQKQPGRSSQDRQNLDRERQQELGRSQRSMKREESGQASQGGRSPSRESRTEDADFLTRSRQEDGRSNGRSNRLSKFTAEYSDDLDE